LLSNGIFCLFDTSGRIYVAVEAFLKVSGEIKACFLGECVSKSETLLDKTWMLADITLARFDFPCDADFADEPAYIENGVLYLNTSEGDDDIDVVGLDTGEVRVVSQLGSKIYSGFTRIEADGQGGNDKIRVQGVSVDVVLHGGDGDDTLVYNGTGRAFCTAEPETIGSTAATATTSSKAATATISSMAARAMMSCEEASATIRSTAATATTRCTAATAMITSTVGPVTTTCMARPETTFSSAATGTTASTAESAEIRSLAVPATIAWRAVTTTIRSTVPREPTCTARRRWERPYLRRYPQRRNPRRRRRRLHPCRRRQRHRLRRRWPRRYRWRRRRRSSGRRRRR
jgi:hypothetical protein